MGNNGRANRQALPATKRLCEVLHLFLQGRHPEHIADELNRSIHTVRNQLQALYGLYEVHGELELMSIFVEAAIFAALEERILSLESAKVLVQFENIHADPPPIDWVI